MNYFFPHPTLIFPMIIIEAVGGYLMQLVAMHGLYVDKVQISDGECLWKYCTSIEFILFPNIYVKMQHLYLS